MSGLNIDSSLKMIGSALLTSLNYQCYSLKELDKTISTIEEIINDPAYLSECEKFFVNSRENYPLFYISNIIYNLKSAGDLQLTPDVLRWLGSVWKNFLNRNASYQRLFPDIDRYRDSLKKYYSNKEGITIINLKTNLNLVKQDFIDGGSGLDSLETFVKKAMSLLGWMKPTYYFLLDYYYAMKLSTGRIPPEADRIERDGVAKFGYLNYTYDNIGVTTCEALGILEAVYLYLKKKKSSRQLFEIDGKKKLLSAVEIYDYYNGRFIALKDEISKLFI